MRVGVIVDISRDQAGSRARGIRRQADLGIGDAHFSVSNRQLAPCAIEVPGPRHRV